MNLTALPITDPLVPNPPRLAQPPSRGSFMRQLIESRPLRSRASERSRLDAYLAVLARVVEDRVIDAEEEVTLSRLVSGLELSAVDIERAHRNYLEALVVAVGTAGAVTDRERNELGEIAALLSVPDSELASMCRPARSPPRAKAAML